MTDHLPSKELLQIADTIERRPVLGYWPHMRAATDAEAVRRAASEIARLRLREQQLSDALIKRRERIEHLQRENDTCGLQCSATLKSLVAENERLRTALTGISTCSTCEACRGAARLALGGVAPAAEPKLISTVEMLREVEDTLIDLGWHKDRGVLKRVTDCLDEVGRTLPPGDGRAAETTGVIDGVTKVTLEGAKVWRDGMADAIYDTGDGAK